MSYDKNVAAFNLILFISSFIPLELISSQNGAFAASLTLKQKETAEKALLVSLGMKQVPGDKNR